ncbi:MAG: nucleoside hydrolase [Ruminococcaceae bacterium]|nr:nucleoside hydrolase [Oscillospiraceae bacterium]
MKKVIIDCDPGHDDAIAIMLAAQHLDILGITTVGGNGYLENVTRNALQILEVIDRTDIKVYPGHAGPSTAKLVIADNVHGESGMEGPVLPQPKIKAQEKHGVDFIVETVMSTDDVTLIATGPLTNIASALNKEPRIAQRVTEISFMGGGAYCGNWTPAAEFNIFVDPEAAYKVVNSGAKIKMCGVNLTRQAIMSVEDKEEMRAYNTKAGIFTAELLDFFGGGKEARMHDASAVAWVIDEDVFKGAMLHVDIELCGRLTRGMTVTDLRFMQTEKVDVDFDFESTRRWDDEPEGSTFRGKEPNVNVGMRCDIERFRKLLKGAIAKYK